jgi:cell division protein FtsI/penicillin-binding protein 2
MVVLLVLTSACGLFDRTPDPGPTVQMFVQNLRGGSVDPATLVDPGLARRAERLLAQTSEDLGTPPQFPLAGPVEVHTPADETLDDPRPLATARLRLRWRLPYAAWAYDTALPLRLIDGRWKIAWTPAVLHPDLREGQSLALRWTTPTRGPILSADGRPLFEPHPVVTVFVQPRRVRNLDHVLAVLEATLQIEVDPLRERVESADRDHLVEVITLRVEDYAPLRTTLQPVPGLVFDLGDQPLTPYRAFARVLLGRLGPPTAEVLDEVGPGFEADDMLGLSGLQREFQHRLAGQPGMRVVSVDEQGERVATLYEVAPTRGEALRTTLDPKVQTAADAALSAVDNPSALVALRASSGEVLAVANGPDGGDVDRALTGRYAPGSTFKVVTTAALLESGLDPDEPVDCPARATVDGRTFRNSEGQAVGRAPFRLTFAQSCNTTMVHLASRLSDDALANAGRRFGFDSPWSPGVDAYQGQIPTPADDVERAAAAIGQARILASPLLMASVAAAIANGTWQPPVLLPDHARPGDGPQPIDPAVADVLSNLMRDVVTRGTGSALLDVSGAPIHAKTGTAEFGEQEPPRTNAWVIAYRGDIAVALLIEDAASGGRDAAPVAATFFRELDGSSALDP